MRVGAFAACLAKWMALPVALGAGAMFLLLPKLEADQAKQRAIDEKNLLEVAKNHDSRNFPAPKVEVTAHKGASVSGRFVASGGGARRKRKKATTSAAAAAAAAVAGQPSAPVQAPTSTPPTAPATGGQETVPVGDGG